MLEVSNFLDQEDLNTFVNFANEIDKIDTAPCKKSHWEIRADGSTLNVIRVAPYKYNLMKDKYHPNVPVALQDDLYGNLEKFWNKYCPIVEQHAKTIIGDSFDCSGFRIFLQYTDMEEDYGFHSHPLDVLVGVLYLTPEKSTGTIFRDRTLSWEVNKLVLFKGDIEHNFVNPNDAHKRFTLNFFFR